MHKLHNGCYIKPEEITALWSERYSDPKLDSTCYLIRALFKNNSTILTLARFDEKQEADQAIEGINKKAN
jgi:hypothetical protein|tara:strand:+ start:54 stop:263 length:210 start_codon:yes stop_codon:yes gene_type:complete